MNGNGQPIPDSVFARIKKLANLATNNSNEHEAALAASKMQKMLFDYELSMADIDNVDLDEKPVEESKIVILEGHRGVQWRTNVFISVARTSLCRVLIGWFTPRPNVTRTTGYLIGRPADVEMAKFTFTYLINELERLVLVYLETYSGWEHKTRARNSWLLGASVGVSKKLNSEFNERKSESPKAFDLIVKKDAALDVFMAERYPNLKGSYSTSGAEYVDRAAYAAGYETGRQLGARRGIEASSSVKQIGG
jgi:hypothetical protein